MRIAIYSSVLYGEDFIVESIKSISPYVDRIVVVLVDRPWGDCSGITYKGSWVEWPKKFDSTRELVENLEKVLVVSGYKYTPWCRHSYGAMLAIGKLKLRANEILFVDPDCIFSEQEAAGFFGKWDQSHSKWAVPISIEFWKSTEYQIIRNRPLVSMHRDLTFLPGMNSTQIDCIDNHVFNMGFCVSETAMRWKHLTSMGFSDPTGEAVPNPSWYEDVWVNWDPIRNNRNLEISIGAESSIKSAVPYTQVVNVPSYLVDKVRRIRLTDKKVGV